MLSFLLLDYRWYFLSLEAFLLFETRLEGLCTMDVRVDEISFEGQSPSSYSLALLTLSSTGCLLNFCGLNGMVTRRIICTSWFYSKALSCLLSWFYVFRSSLDECLDVISPWRSWFMTCELVLGTLTAWSCFVNIVFIKSTVSSLFFGWRRLFMKIWLFLAFWGLVNDVF